ncbi:SDR family NAD(P)-dependent oxidoreductase [Lapillicoccus jejuensis]|uniref:Short-subunit dehydrogenase n=1 Tax=Lapillicoccus jejuensis TaxID=402171 RepID=A0A542DX35_9MICO|nr:SDR family oxidoreductase [Lapillicoccus jejuensis]TQJ07652.1 short-subunit dehydrogenase [Lapillicoccus jejuensis]
MTSGTTPLPRTAVVTGAAGGIGAAIAARLVAEGVRVLLADRDRAVEETARALGGNASSYVGDCATETGVELLLFEADEVLGEVDLFCANAGVEGGRGLESSEADWATALEVNVLAHVRAAQALVPRWVERGHGRFVVTASAAGLLTMLGSAPYSVTKHGAVAFAEWLRATYAHKGIVVQAICPQGVRTRMLDDSGPLRELLSRDRALEPSEVADRLWEALQDDRFLVLPHPEVADYYVARATDPDRWLAGMNRLQRKLEETR